MTVDTPRLDLRGLRLHVLTQTYLSSGVLQDAVFRSLAASTRLLDAAEGGDLGGDETGVETDDGVRRRLGHPPASRKIAGLAVAGETKLCVVGRLNDVCLRREPKKRRHGSEDLLARHRHLWRYPGEDGWLEEGATERVLLAAGEDFRALADCIGDIL